MTKNRRVGKAYDNKRAQIGISGRSRADALMFDRSSNMSGRPDGRTSTDLPSTVDTAGSPTIKIVP